MIARIALALAISAFCIVETHAADPGTHQAPIPGVSTKILLKTTKAWNGQTLPSYGAGPAEITIMRYEFAPGASIPVHMHPVVNGGVLLSGELTIKTTTGQTIVVKPGDAVVETFKQWHSGANTSPVKAELIMFYAGHPGVPLVIRK